MWKNTSKESVVWLILFLVFLIYVLFYLPKIYYAYYPTLSMFLPPIILTALLCKSARTSLAFKKQVFFQNGPGLLLLGGFCLFGFYVIFNDFQKKLEKQVYKEISIETVAKISNKNKITHRKYTSKGTKQGPEFILTVSFYDINKTENITNINVPYHIYNQYQIEDTITINYLPGPPLSVRLNQEVLSDAPFTPSSLTNSLNL